ncbi:hypothetical protein [Sphaerisporangium sp. NPDC051011]|uniref:hypothetical protein n=1 Tax=Sphaerisporangium sp. NPDC051011 TaxID=3155792 RepID=UPI0033EEED4C
MVHRPSERGPSLVRHLSGAATLGALVGLGLSAAFTLTGTSPELVIVAWAAAVVLGAALGAGLWARARTDYRRDEFR